MARIVKVAAYAVPVIVFVLIGLAVLCTPARAGNCGHFFVKQQVAYVAPIYAAPVYYQAGKDIEAEALAEKVARLVAPKIAAQLKAGNVPQQQTASQSMLAQHCAKCHSGATPKANTVYDGVTELACFQVTAALRSIRDESMPKDHKISPEVKGAIMEELLNLERKEVIQ